MKLAVFLAAAAALLAAASAQSVDQNTYDAMVRKKSSCQQTYANLEAQWYANNQVCKDQVFKALDTYVKADCPSTAKDSEVWKCMNGYNAATGAVNPAIIDSWRQFLQGCEVLYIANRDNSGESESGFVWKDNSCFPRFNDLAAFVSYLQSGTGGKTVNANNNPGSAGAATISFSSLFAGVMLVLAMLWA